MLPAVRVAPTAATTSTTAVPLSELRARYWLTRDGTAPLQYWCDWAQVGCGTITGSFVATSALSAITFTTYDTGTLGNFLDNVVVTAQANVVESSPLALLLIGLTGLVLIRRKNHA